MSNVTPSQIASLRAKTGISMMQCKKALEESAGDEEKAIEYLRKKGELKAQERSGRETKEGIIGFYMHPNNKVSSFVKLTCETDFVAKNAEFQEFAKNLAMHVAAMNPAVLSPDEVSQEFLAKEKEITLEQLKNEGKPENMIENIWIGKEAKLKNEMALLEQGLVMNPEVIVKNALLDLQTKMGENIKIESFVRYEI